MTITRPVAFNKRIFTLATLLRSVRDLIAHVGDLRLAVSQRQVSRAFAEKIMLAVTQVNGCRYCSYAHARMALKAGIDVEELQQLMHGDFQSVALTELVAILFAQQYAEQRDQIDTDAWQRLTDTYGLDTAQAIMAYIRMITVANLLGNTFDAVLSRFAGRPAPGSRFIEEIGVLTLALLLTIISPLVVLTYRLMSRFYPAGAPSPL